MTDDVRMVGFSQRQTVAAALAWLDAQTPRPLDAEPVPLRDAAGRVLAHAITSEVDVPGFDRATMDGYAVLSNSTEGASAYNRIELRVLGDALPGAPFDGSIGAGQAVRIMTGAPMPRGADAVLPAEWIEPADRPAITATASVSPGKHVGLRGEDIARGTVILEAGRVLRPQDLGIISSIGREEVAAVRRPVVALAITGNELLPAGTTPHGARIADANGPMLEALVQRDGGLLGGTARCATLVRDDAEAILAALHAPADIVIVSGGSSVGIEDLAPTLLASHGELAIHGVAMRPSSPTGMGRLEHRLVFLLPGNPVSSLCAYDFFAGRAIRALGGRDRTWPYRAIRGTLTRKISSPIGRLDYARVKIDAGRASHVGGGSRSSPGETAVEPIAIAGASVLSSTTRADGFVVVPDDSEGFAAGAEVDVWLYA